MSNYYNGYMVNNNNTQFWVNQYLVVNEGDGFDVQSFSQIKILFVLEEKLIYDL